jgi:hypothetical protein
LRAGEEKTPIRPRHFVSVNQVASAHCVWCVRPSRSKKTLVAQALLDRFRHAVVRIDLALFGLPQMMREEF